MHLPFPFLDIPEPLKATVPPSTPAEVNSALAVRRSFNLPGWPDPYLNDVVRAFRLAQGKRAYVEVGSRDKGNVAWLARHALASDATIVDIDIDPYPDQEKKLKSYLKPKQSYHPITGSCLDSAVIDKVKNAIGPRGADIIFCDTQHTFQHTLAEFDAYYPLVARDGLLIFHDCYFENNGQAVKGKSLGLAQLDRLLPVYVVFADEPTHRHLPREINDPVWGGCGIICKGATA
jgi:hypothetical protein